MIGAMTHATMESFAFISVISVSARIMRTMIWKTEMNCSWKKFLMRSTSLVQRWMISPVGCSACHFHGRHSMWWKSRSRAVLTSVSPALALNMFAP